MFIQTLLLLLSSTFNLCNVFFHSFWKTNYISLPFRVPWQTILLISWLFQDKISPASTPQDGQRSSFFLNCPTVNAYFHSLQCTKVVAPARDKLKLKISSFIFLSNFLIIYLQGVCRELAPSGIESHH